MHTEPGMHNDFTHRLMSAMQMDEFVLHSQAIVPLAPQPESRALNEIFIRFQEEDAKLLPPGMFFPMLQEAGMLPVLDRWVVNRMARHVRTGLKLDSHWNIPRYIVNLSDETLDDAEFADYVLQYTADSYLSGGTLGFDISCDSALAHRESLMQLMNELRPHGCSLAIAGFDGVADVLPKLKVLAPDFVKINVRNVDPAKIPAINRACHELRAQTIAEQVENARQLDHLRRCKVDYAQGFALAGVEPL
jgi:EAL domain-containing protein (putative c-di-GMP-specific phosphodiesterase class I)